MFAWIWVLSIKEENSHPSESHLPSIDTIPRTCTSTKWKFGSYDGDEKQLEYAIDYVGSWPTVLHTVDGNYIATRCFPAITIFNKNQTPLQFLQSNHFVLIVLCYNQVQESVTSKVTRTVFLPEAKTSTILPPFFRSVFPWSLSPITEGSIPPFSKLNQ